MAAEESIPSPCDATQVDQITLGHDSGLAQHYQAYLLRLWRTGAGEWRGSLQSAQNGERHLFAELDDLFAFLRMQLDT